jgi:hypothetical protein
VLLTTVSTHVPASEEVDADLSEYGTLGLNTRASFGAAAAQVGSPDSGVTDARTTALDVVANVLHWLADEDPDADLETVATMAVAHVSAERH